MKIDLLVGFNSGEDIQKNIYNVLEIKDFYENFYKPNDLSIPSIDRFLTKKFITIDDTRDLLS